VDVQLKKEDHEEPDPTIRILPEEPLEECLVIKPSPKFQEPKEFIEDMISLIQYPQDESPPIVSIEDLFLEIVDPSFHSMDLFLPIDITQCSYIKVSLFSPKPVPEFPSYFLSFPESSHVSKIIRLHFVEVSIMHTFIMHVRFVFYFWYTLWNLLGVYCKFSYACQAKIKPRELIIY